MSIRVATVNFASAPLNERLGGGDPYYLPWTKRSVIGFPPDILYYYEAFEDSDVVIEASPIYTQIEVRLRITGGDDDGFDETVTFARVAFSVVTPNTWTGAGLPQGDIGFDYGIFTGNYTSSDKCLMYVGQEGRGDLGYYADPKKQQLNIYGSKEFVTRDGYGLVYIHPPFFLYEDAWPATGTRDASTKWGYGSSSGQYVDASAWSATEWRDYRGTYSADVTGTYYAFGGTSATYDWTLS